MSGPLKRIAAALDYVPETDEDGKPYPWARPFAGLQSLLRDVVQRLNATPWTTGRAVAGTFAAGVPQTLSHGLGREPKRWAVEDMTAGYGPLYRTAWTSTGITLVAFSDCTATVRVE